MMTIITKLATHTTDDHNSQLKMEHLANTNDSSNLSDIFARCGRMITALLENTLSTEAELAGTARIHRTSIQGAQIPSGYKRLQALCHCQISK